MNITNFPKNTPQSLLWAIFGVISFLAGTYLILNNGFSLEPITLVGTIAGFILGFIGFCIIIFSYVIWVVTTKINLDR